MKVVSRYTPFYLVLLLLVWHGASSQVKSDIEIPSPLHEKTFPLELHAGFLAPGLQKATAKRGDELRFGPIDWVSPTYGMVIAEMWGVSSLVTVEVTADHKTPTAMRIDPVARVTGESLWNLWRHRHGYQFFHGQGYLWNSLEDKRPVLDPNEGAFFDRQLRNLWGFWVKKRLVDYLASGNTASGVDWSSSPLNGEDAAKLNKSIRLRYSKDGLRGAYPILFQINLWNVPVKIDFEMIPSTAAKGEALIVIARKYRWRYDMSEWRRRHGYERNFLGDYVWDKDFPEGDTLSKKDGLLLDRLLENSVALWVETAVEQVMSNLNRNFSEAVRELKSP